MPVHRLLLVACCSGLLLASPAHAGGKHDVAIPKGVAQSQGTLAPAAVPDAQDSPVPGSTTPARVIYADDFEKPSLAGWKTSGDGNDTATVTTSEKYKGASSVLLKLGPTDRTPYRTEIALKQDLGRLYSGTNYCLKFAFMVKDWSNFPKWVTLLQTHSVPLGNDFSCPAGRNPVSLTSGSARMLSVAVVDTPRAKRPGGAIGTVVHSQPLTMDHWYTARIQFRPAFDDKGVIQVWIDDQKVYSQSGANMDSLDQCGRQVEPFSNLKIGLYKERTNTGTQSIYFDDFYLAEDAECK